MWRLYTGLCSRCYYGVSNFRAVISKMYYCIILTQKCLSEKEYTHTSPSVLCLSGAYHDASP